ncbi:integral membrane protein [Metarhizium brunneum]
MDSNSNAGPSHSRSQRSLRAPSDRNRASTLSAASLAGPATPAESDAPADEYFEPLSTAASRRSRISTASHGWASSAGVPESNATERPRRPSIRIRRSSLGVPQSTSSTQDAATAPQQQQEHDGGSEALRGNRPRSASQPSPAPPPVGDAAARGARNSRRMQPQIALPRLTEEGARPTMAELGLEGTSPLSPSMSMPPAPALERSHSDGEAGVDEAEGKKPRRSIVGRLWKPSFRRTSVTAPAQGVDPMDTDEYNDELVDWLDIIDPEVQTLSTLTNVQNSLFVPDLGSWVNRRPTYVLSQSDTLLPRPVSAREPIQQLEQVPTIREDEEEAPRPEEGEADQPPYIRRTDTITSRLSDSHYAALPHGRKLEGWSAAEKWELDDRVRHMMHSRRSRFKRQMKGFGQYVRRPLGFFVTLYATLITLFGLAWVLFLIGWIYVGEQQVYAIHIIDSVLVALFAIMGDGLAPFRAVDTYHMIFIARYARKIAKAKKQAAKELARTDSSPETQNTDASEERRGTPTPPPPPQEEQRKPELPNGSPTLHQPAAADGIPPITLEGDNNPGVDLEDAKSETCSLEYDYLTPKQRKSLEHHQKKLSKSHSFYKPHETFTHHAFPLGHLIAIIVLLDCHSCLQISLGATTWGIDYHHRPFAITTVILCVSITCNLTAGLVIMFGDRKTRKKDVVELLERQALTGDAIKKVERKREKEATPEESERDKESVRQQEGDVGTEEKNGDKGKDKEIEVPTSRTGQVLGLAGHEVGSLR